MRRSEMQGTPGAVKTIYTPDRLEPAPKAYQLVAVDPVKMDLPVSPMWRSYTKRPPQISGPQQESPRKAATGFAVWLSL